VQRLLRVAVPTRPTALDREQPGGLFQFPNLDAHLQLYDPLLEYRGAPLDEAGSSASTRLGPGLAERWEALDGGARYRIFLRQGVHSAFDNELTAEDVAWTWHRSLALGTVGAWIAGNAGIASPDQVEPVDRHVVEFRLPQPTTLLPHLLAVIAPTIFDSQEARRHATAGDPWALDRLREQGAGFGAYVVDGEGRLRANPRYWRGPPAYEQVEFLAVPDPEERWAALRRGEADVAVDLPAQADGRPLLAPMTLHTQLRLNCTRPPFDRVEVRHAVALAIPYDRILDVAYGGRARRMRSCVADTVLGHTAEHARWDYRPDEARALLRRFAPLPRVELAYHEELPAFPATAEIVAEALSAVGLETGLTALDAEEHGLRKAARTLDLFLDHYWPMTIDGRYGIAYEVNPSPGGVFDYCGYHNREIDRLLKESVTELDPARVDALLGEVQRLALADVPSVPLAQEYFVFALADSVTGYRWYPLPRLRCRELRPTVP
jgi:peptide/nickel transport system substrate-binding protein